MWDLLNLRLMHTLSLELDALSSNTRKVNNTRPITLKSSPIVFDVLVGGPQRDRLLLVTEDLC